MKKIYLLAFLLFGLNVVNGKVKISKEEEPIAFQYLLNMPMGISPAQLKEYLGNCPSSLSLFDVNNNDVTNSLDVSTFQNQTIYRIYLGSINDGRTSLHTVHFSFFIGKLYSVEGNLEWDFYEHEFSKNKKRTMINEYYNQYNLYNKYRDFFGIPKLVTREILWEGFAKKEKYPIWSVGNKTFGIYDEPPRSVYFIQIDSITNIVRSLESLKVDVQVLLSIPAYPFFSAKWKNIDLDSIVVDANTNEGRPLIVDTLFFGLYCVKIKEIFIKGDGNDLTFTVSCVNGSIVFEKNGINVRRKTRVVNNENIFNNCSEKVDRYGELVNKYTLTVSKLGHPLFVGNIYIHDCMN
jgi:hypothetical protein